jgi:hypothetical protein
MKYPLKSLGPTYTITNPFAKGWILLFFGLIPIIIGLAMQLNTLAFLSSADSATGTILQCKLETTTAQGKTTTNDFPVIRFQTQSGQSITFQSSESDDNCWEGDTRTVKYQPDDPHNARLDASSNIWLAFIGIGSLFVLWSFICFFEGIVRKAKVRRQEMKS